MNEGGGPGQSTLSKVVPTTAVVPTTNQQNQRPFNMSSIVPESHNYDDDDDDLSLMDFDEVALNLMRLDEGSEYAFTLSNNGLFS